MSTTGTGGASASATHSGLTMAAMVCAVSMTFIDMTIVAIASPTIQAELQLSQTGLQWVINGYLLSLAAFFAFGGRLADTWGHVRTVVVGVVVFATASLLVGLTPTSIGEPWIITFRIVQGFGAALLFPAALSVVLAAYPLERRGRAAAVFFGVAGGLTAVGPIAGGFLSEWTWRAIFWVNIPVAVAALVLTAMARPADTRSPARMDLRGLALIVVGMGASVFGLQQTAVWGWTSPLVLASIVGGLAVLAVFVVVELRTEQPLIDVRIFTDRAFAAQNAVLFFAMVAFIPVFFFGSMYAQISLGQSGSGAGLYLLIFFAGFAPGVQVGGRLLDRSGARTPVVVGCAVAAVGYALWGMSLPDLSEGAQWWRIVIAGAGTGLMVGPSNTDAVNRAGPARFGEGTGITQTVRNYGSALGMAVLGTLLITINTGKVESTLEANGMSAAQADQVAHALSTSAGGTSALPSSGSTSAAQDQALFAAVQADFAESTKIVFLGMAGAMAMAFVVALAAVPAGKQETEAGDAPTPLAPQDD